MPKHQHPQREDILKRLARIGGHVEAVRKMVAEDRPCAEVLQQVAAVQSALEKARLMLIEDHLEHCVAEQMGREKGKAVVNEIKATLGLK